MASPLETTGSSPSRESNPPPSFNSAQEPELREWSQPELDTVCALICKLERYGTSQVEATRRSRPQNSDGNNQENDVEGWVFQFTTKLNETLQGMDHYEYDIPVADVRELMDFLETDNKAVMAYIERQSIPFRVTRSKTYAFQRICNNFNDIFYDWTLTRRGQRRNQSISPEDEVISQLGSIGSSVSSEEEENRISAAAGLLDYPRPFATTQRGRISNSGRTRRRRVVSRINRTSDSGQDRNAYSPQQSILPAKPGLHFRRKNTRGIMSSPTPLPRQTRRAHSDYLDSTPSSPTPLPPTSPAYLGHADLRQSIHPMGPMPETPLPTYQNRSELRQGIHMTGQQPGTPGPLTSPTHASPYSASIHKGYQYSEAQQVKGNSDDRSVAETPASPFSPRYVPGTMSPGANTGAQASIEPLYEDGYGNELYPSSGDYSEYSVNYRY